MEAIDPSLVIIDDVWRVRLVLLLLLVALAGCGDRLHNKEKVQEAIVKRLQSRSGLDLKSLDVTTTSVSFDKNLAYATVAFHPKGDPSVNSGLVMKYTLQDRNGNWEVVNVGDSRGGPVMGHGTGAGGQLPAGHPGGSALPPGHPAVGSGAEGHAQ